MTRACLLLTLAIGCTTEPAEEAPPPPSIARAAVVATPPPMLPAAPIVIDLSNDAIVLQAEDDDGSDVDDDVTVGRPAVLDDAVGDVLDVQDRCPDVPDGDEDVDGCPEPAPPPAA